MIRYAITGGTSSTSETDWLENVRQWLRNGVDLIQIREPLSTTRELARLVRQALALPNPHGARILVNDRADVAIACEAHGVHLRDHSIRPEKLRHILPPGFLISVSCHDIAGVLAAESADYILAAPVFPPLSKQGGRAPLGLDGLRSFAGATKTPVLALGGITPGNAQSCVDAGAKGVAGITLFHPRAKAVECAATADVNPARL